MADPREEEVCSTSTHIERHCQADEAGAMRCETIKRMYRHCPGRPPEELSVERTEGDAEASSLFSSPWSLLGLRPRAHEDGRPPHGGFPFGGSRLDGGHPPRGRGPHDGGGFSNDQPGGFGQLGGADQLGGFGQLFQQMEAMVDAAFGGGLLHDDRGRPVTPGHGGPPAREPERAAAPTRVRVEEI